MNAMHGSQTCDTEALNALLRGELAAVETYTQAMGTFADELVIADLQKIRDEHSRAVRELRDQVIRFGGTPPERALPWGAFVSAGSVVAGAAKAISAATALAALRQGEEHTASEFESALENAEVPPESRQAIRTELLAACRRHVEELNRLLGGMDR